MPDIDYVRVSDAHAEFTTSRTSAESDGLTVLDHKPAVDQIGRPLPAKPKVSKASGPSPKSAQAASPEEEK